MPAHVSRNERSKDCINPVRISGVLYGFLFLFLFLFFFFVFFFCLPTYKGRNMSFYVPGSVLFGLGQCSLPSFALLRLRLPLQQSELMLLWQQARQRNCATLKIFQGNQIFLNRSPVYSHFSPERMCAVKHCTLRWLARSKLLGFMTSGYVAISHWFILVHGPVPSLSCPIRRVIVNLSESRRRCCCGRASLSLATFWA